jgi:hypothetical protein
MFRGSADQVNIKVGVGRPSCASYYLSEPTDVAILLAHVLDLCEMRTTAAQQPRIARSLSASAAAPTVTAY